MTFPFKNQIGIVVVVLVVLVLFLNPVVTVQSGNVGILKTFGKFSDVELDPGIHFIIPGMQSVEKVDVKVYTFNYSRADKRDKEGIVNLPPIQVLDQRGLPIIIEQTIQFRLSKTKASETVARWGPDWSIKIINPTVREVVRDIVGGFPAEIIPIKRQEIAIKIDESVRTKVEKISEESVEIVGVQLRNVELPTEIAQKIKEVQVAKQEADKTVYLEEKAKREQQVRLIQAETAKLEKIKAAEGQSASRIKVAEGLAKSNELLNRSLTPNVIKWKELEVQQVLADSIRTNEKATLFINTPGAADLHMWLDKK